MLNKPPIGIKPKYIHDEQRQQELKMAIARYLNEDAVIPIEWIKEYNELTYTIKRRNLEISLNPYPKGFIIVNPYGDGG